MRRYQIVLGATALGTAGVLAFQPHPQGVATATATARSTSAKAVTASSTSHAGGSSSAQSAVGQSISTIYGPVQVRVTVKDGKLTSVEPLALTGDDPRSQEISAQAEPILRQEALQKQSANIEAVSGATFTSAGYAQSLQSALGKLGFKTAPTTLQVPAGDGGGH